MPQTHSLRMLSFDIFVISQLSIWFALSIPVDPISHLKTRLSLKWNCFCFPNSWNFSQSSCSCNFLLFHLETSTLPFSSMAQMYRKWLPGTFQTFYLNLLTTSNSISAQSDPHSEHESGTFDTRLKGVSSETTWKLLHQMFVFNSFCKCISYVHHRLFVLPSKTSHRPFVTEKYRIVYCQCTYDVYDAIIITMTIIIICVRCDHHHDDNHHHFYTMRLIIIIVRIWCIRVRCIHVQCVRARCNGAWVTRPERPKDEVKEAQRATD